jgi:hypothetical protein
MKNYIKAGALALVATILLAMTPIREFLAGFWVCLVYVYSLEYFKKN